MSDTSEAGCPPEVLGLVPWYPDAGLSVEERRRVESHAAECPDCRRELEAMARGDADEPIAVPADTLFERVLAEIEVEDAERFAARREQPRPRRALAWLRDRELNLPGFGAPVALSRGLPVAASFLGLALFAGWLFSQPPGPADLEGPLVGRERPTVSLAPEIDVVFRDTATAAEIQTALEAVGGEVIAGPTAFGRYRVRLAPEADAAAAAKALVGDAEIARFAEPVGD